ncbi:MAG: GTPase ObgE [Nitrospirales bacterium]|nr:GTPase ObgE [Nitrospira sp.]MDR4500246.1 GTPase ObgE [Nitrospirales bacterium]
MFIDQARILVKAGSGGHGACSFRREKYVPRGGPDGGDGGDGGNVLLKASTRVATLLDFRYQRHYEAPSGLPGQGSNKFGSTGEDIIIPVPVGTIVKDGHTEEILADLVEDQQTIVIAHGGKGGRGNSHFATSTNRAPRQFETGTPGEERALILELKLLADVGLVGFPNAGKSTFISSISSAHPEIASYPFTTLRPHLGVVRVTEDHSFVVADIPGLIEGAHEGKGLGFQFLRHIQRTAFLLFLIDISEWSADSPVTTLETLRKELEAYDADLAKRPFAVVATKIDSQGTGELREQLSTHCKARNIAFFPISAVTQEGLQPLLSFLDKHVSQMRNPCETNS